MTDSSTPTPAPSSGRWVDDDGTIWWEFGAGEAMEPAEALQNYTDNQQFDAAYAALAALINGDFP